MTDSDNEGINSMRSRLGWYLGWLLVFVGGLLLAATSPTRTAVSERTPHSNTAVESGIDAEAESETSALLGAFWGTSLSGALLYLIVLAVAILVDHLFGVLDGPISLAGVPISPPLTGLLVLVSIALASLCLWVGLVFALVQAKLVLPTHAADGLPAALKAHFVLGLPVLVGLIYVFIIFLLLRTGSVLPAVGGLFLCTFVIACLLYVGGGAVSVDSEERVGIAVVTGIGLLVVTVPLTAPGAIADILNTVFGLELPTKYDLASKAQLFAATVPVAVGKMFAALVHASSLASLQRGGQRVLVMLSELLVGAIVAVVAFLLVFVFGSLITSAPLPSRISVVAFALTLFIGFVADLSRNGLVSVTTDEL
ncbi:hypothetical protein [Salinigranum halophilum]|uniref:hypothetical protein n=1 Tax=Salinigranum halophilum TaxID=2565931 RepID=UPI0010A872D9|nr:hypothetical protein [Salinigranum halophilum]